MSAVPVPAEKHEAPGQHTGGLSLPKTLWWLPSRIVIHTGRGWITLHHPYDTAKTFSQETLGVSPIGTDGWAYFCGWDVDHGGWETVQALLQALPSGAIPLVSRSGGRNGKGHHLWCFPTDPIPVDVAVVFAAEIRRLAGIPCEAFPTSRNSRCFKWPGSYHPETGVQETFVDIRTGGETELDTQAVLEMLAAGMLRTPTRVFYQVAARSPLAPSVLTRRLQDRPTSSKDNQAPIKQQSSKTQAPAEAPARDPSMLESLARDERLAAWLMRQAGRKPVPIGRSFWCILHRERHPSAAFHRTEDGRLLYHDMHASKHDTPEWLTLGEVYAALRTGHVRRLRPHESAMWLAKAGIDANILPPSTFNATLLANSTFQAWVGTTSENNCDVYMSGCSHPAPPDPEVTKVWECCIEQTKVALVCGFAEILASARFLAREAGVELWEANKAANLLAVLGFLEKVPSGGRGDRWRMLTPKLEDVLVRWELLGRPSLREFNAKLVAEKLGEDVARAVFRR